MGTPEFPDLGKHCSAPDCNQLDFLPFTCDVCRQVFCLEHRSYSKHDCANAPDKDVTVLVCPLCAKAVRLVPHEDPNVTFDHHVKTACDPSNYEKVHKKPRCLVRGCKEVLTTTNRMTCKDCKQIVCLKHRFGPDHGCKGPMKSANDGPWYGSQIMQSFRQTVSAGGSGQRASAASSSSSRKTGWDSATSVIWASAEAGLNKISNLTTNVLNAVSSSSSSSSSSSNQRPQQQRPQSGSQPYRSNGKSSVSNAQSKMTSYFGNSDARELCPQCGAQFATVSLLVQHVEAAHSTDKQVSINDIVDLCPKCGKGFRDPVSLVNHVELDHGGTSIRRK